jgi:hypothetical protein
VKSVQNPNGSWRPDVPRPVMRIVGLAFRLAWHCIPTRTLCRACNYTRGERVTAWHRVVLWICGMWSYWDQGKEEREG